MAQVPYSPVPDVAPSGQGVSPMHVTVPEGAFGGEVGRALNKFGAVLEHSGDELFKTAMQLQEQKNEAEAIEGDARLANKLTELHEKFITKEGKNASEGLMDYTAEVDKTRKEIRDSLSNDAVRRKYDRNALRSQEIAVRGGASHAGKELRKFSHDAEQAGINLEKQRVIDNPNDPTEPGEARVEQLVWQAGRRAGKDDKTIEAEARFQKGEVIANRIDALTDEKPEEAQKLLNIAIAEKRLWGNEAPKLQKRITEKLNEVVTRNIAHTAISDPTLSEGEVLKLTKELAVEKGLDLKGQDMAVDRARGLYKQKEAVKRDDALRDMEIIKADVMDRDVKDMDQLFQNKETMAAIKRLPESKRMDLQGMINRYQAAKNKPINDEEIRRLISLRTEDPIAFADLDPTKLPLSASQMKEVKAWQKADRKKPHEDAKVGQAMKWLRESRGAELEALKVYSRKKDVNEAEYDRFQGGVSIALDVWHDEHKRYPDQKEFLKDLAPSLIVREMKPGFFYGQNVKREGLIFEPVPAWWDKQFRDKYRMDTGLELQEHEVQRNFLRYRLMLAEDIKKEQKGLRGAGGL